MTMSGHYAERGGEQGRAGRGLSGCPVPLSDSLLQLELALVRPLKEVLFLQVPETRAGGRYWNTFGLSCQHITKSAIVIFDPVLAGSLNFPRPA